MDALSSKSWYILGDIINIVSQGNSGFRAVEEGGKRIVLSLMTWLNKNRVSIESIAVTWTGYFAEREKHRKQYIYSFLYSFCIKV